MVVQRSGVTPQPQLPQMIAWLRTGRLVVGEGTPMGRLSDAQAFLSLNEVQSFIEPKMVAPDPIVEPPPIVRAPRTDPRSASWAVTTVLLLIVIGATGLMAWKMRQNAKSVPTSSASDVPIPSDPPSLAAMTLRASVVTVRDSGRTFAATAVVRPGLFIVGTPLIGGQVDLVYDEQVQPATVIAPSESKLPWRLLECIGKLKKVCDRPFVSIGQSTSLAPGDPITAVGPVTVNERVIKQGTVDKRYALVDDNLYIRAHQLGFEGVIDGPLLNASGRLMGIVATTHTLHQRTVLAIPIEYATHGPDPLLAEQLYDGASGPPYPEAFHQALPPEQVEPKVEYGIELQNTSWYSDGHVIVYFHLYAPLTDTRTSHEITVKFDTGTVVVGRRRPSYVDVKKTQNVREFHYTVVVIPPRAHGRRPLSVSVFVEPYISKAEQIR